MTDKAKKFISEKIKLLIKEGYERKQAVAIAFSMARKAGYKIPVYKKSNPYSPNEIHKVLIGPPNQDPQAIYELTLAGISQLLDKVKIPELRNIFGVRSGDAFAAIVQALHGNNGIQFVIMCEDHEDMVKTVDYLQDSYFP